MADTMKIKLLERLGRNNVGDVIEVRNHEARALVTLRKAEYHTSSSRTRTQTRVMEPAKASETPPAETTHQANPPTNAEPANAEVVPPTENPENLAETGVFGGQRQPYGRRDMEPEQ